MKSTFTFLFSLFALVCNAQTLSVTPYGSGFSNVVEITHPPADSRLFIVQKTGAIKILNTSGTVNATNFLTLTTATISTGSERGLLGLAFHPDYATNGYFYVNYTNLQGHTVVARYQVSSNPNVADPASGTIKRKRYHVLDSIRSQHRHHQAIYAQGNTSTIGHLRQGGK